MPRNSPLHGEVLCVVLTSISGFKCRASFSHAVSPAASDLWPHRCSTTTLSPVCLGSVGILVSKTLNSELKKKLPIVVTTQEAEAGGLFGMPNTVETPISKEDKERKVGRENNIPRFTFPASDPMELTLPWAY